MTKRLQGILLNESVAAAIVSLICFAVYLTTMCRTVSFIDAGEFATVATVLGIAHPTGYPLFTLLAHGFLRLPIGGEEVFRLNLFSSFVVALGVGVFFKLLLASLPAGDLKHHESQNTVSAGKPGLLFAAATGSLIFGLSTTVWSQSVAVEVYGLHIVLVLLTALFVLKGTRQDAGGSDSIPRTDRCIVSAWAELRESSDDSADCSCALVFVRTFVWSEPAIVDSCGKTSAVLSARSDSLSLFPHTWQPPSAIRMGNPGEHRTHLLARVGQTVPQLDVLKLRQCGETVELFHQPFPF